VSPVRAFPDILDIHFAFATVFVPAGPLTGRGTSDLAQFGDELMADVAKPGNLAVRPTAPFVIIEQLEDGAALVFFRAGTTMRGIGAGGKKYRITQTPSSDFTPEVGLPSTLGGAVPVQTVR
jgi:hypothetical protein